ncbi:molybdenum ABC transporter ATP-binding protein [Fretibacterium sp. OH1220_COT-178]|uniref:molybdenum ABC transporter ATP-binding protein n=1 Tax=Fretibacterium sp. OH1220_COT-178 TaxID=2491047 RepID=UPI000F5EFD6F|nr:ATP-binding cassette domain-containing protein [Fretibacterium sp. OH1220_COT-178]RRD66231.1 ATP-binding cassette domain-containing protein [Fretibacterium sp. OH1220_COT-178]
MLEVRVRKRLGNFSTEADFALEEVGITALYGPSGAGKTTLLNMVAGLVVPDEGRIVCDGTAFFDSERKIFLPVQQRGIGYVFQEHRLFSHLSVRNNLLFASRFCGRPFSRDYFDRVAKLLELGPMLDRTTSSLSGGESQRVAIGRALLACTSVLLMDEPLASLDSQRKEELMRYIATIPRRLGVSVLYVTHAEDKIPRLADRVLLVRRGAKTRPAPAGNGVGRPRHNEFAPSLDDRSIENTERMGVKR